MRYYELPSDEKFSVANSLEIFDNETKKLESSISSALTKPELPLSEIIQIYYQIMNTTSLASVLKQQSVGSDEHNSVIRKIEETQKLISENFDINLHPSIMSKLTNSLAETTKQLRSINILEKSKDEIESEAQLYEKLRQTMSTKEFVEQYDKGLSHD